MVVCRISLLDGTTYEPKDIDKNSTGQTVFDKVTSHLDLIETDYFGLTYRDKTGKKFWLDNTKKIANQVKGGTWVFEFQVKFYAPDPHSLKEDLTRYQLCLQVRVDIFNGRLVYKFSVDAVIIRASDKKGLPCSFVTYALLGSYTVQAELGDYDSVASPGSIEYLNDFDFAPQQQPELLEKIAELHKHHKGQTPEEAESHFLENAKKLAMYGVDLHDVKDVESKPLVLGVCASGILVYKDRLRINRFVWPKILKLSYKRNIFYVQIRPGPQDPHERTVGFKLDNHKLAKRLWKICVEHHAFFRLKDMEGQGQGTLFPRFNTKFRYSGRTQAQAKKAAEEVHREEPHIKRTAERRSLKEAKSLDEMAFRKNDLENQGHPDEKDMYDKRKGDPSATMGVGQYPDQNNLEDGKRRRGPGDESEDRRDKQHGEGDKKEGMPGYQGDTSGLQEGGMVGPKGKKEKEDEKKRKKEEERKRKEEEKEREKERKRLEKLEKEKKKTEDKTDRMKDPNATQTAINGHPDSAELDQDGRRLKLGPGGSPDKGKDRDADKGDKDGKDGTKYETDIDAILAGKHGDARDRDEAGKERGRGGKDGDKDGKDRDRDKYGKGADKHGKDWDKHGKAGDKDWDKYGKDGDKDRDRYGKDGDKDRDKYGKDGDKDRDKYGKDGDKDRDKYGKDRDKDGKDDKEGGKHGKKDDGKDGKHGKKGDKGDSFKGDKDKKGGLFGRFGKKSPSKKDKDFDPSKFHGGEDDFPPPLPPAEGEMDKLRQKKKVGMTWALPGMEELKERQHSGSQGLNKTGLRLTEDLSEQPGSYTSTAQIGLATPEYAGSDAFPGADRGDNSGDTQIEDQQAGFGPGDYGMSAGDDKSIDRKMQFMPIVPPTTETRDKNKSGGSYGSRMPFFEPAGESSTDDSSLGRRGPPPVAKKPKAPGGYDSEEDRLLRRSGEPPTVQTESFKYTPNLDELPMSTSNIPIVETKTHTVTYEKDGVPFEQEDSILISAHSVTTKSQTIDTTTYKTERDGVIETRVERKITVTSDENDDTDHDALLRAAIEEVTKMNPDLSVERIECIKQIEGEK